MFTHCIHCTADLGSNECLEAFPVGKRVAFDEARGRLWVVCPKCERWNLAPFESRWEAIEEAERTYRDTRVRLATDNVGLAVTRGGTSLVRIGRPLRPEFAAWRYGDQFGRRRRRAWFMGGAAVVGGGLAVSGLAATGAGLVVMAPLLNAFSLSMAAWQSRARWLPLAHPDGGWFIPVGNPRLVPSTGEEGWAIEMAWQQRMDSPTFGVRNLFTGASNGENGRVVLSGELARAALARTLPKVNGAGASKARVRDAVDLLDEAGGADAMLPWAMSQRRAWGERQTFGDTGDLGAIPAPARLAIEMAVHEERERLALLGELGALERAWVEAERVARIADGLLVPPEVEQRLASLRERAAGSDSESTAGES